LFGWTSCSRCCNFTFNFSNALLTDSKQLSEKHRNELKIIIENEAIAYAVSFVYQGEIDRINILRASITAMHRAIDLLKITPEFYSS
jgi:ribonuclease HII